MMPCLKDVVVRSLNNVDAVKLHKPEAIDLGQDVEGGGLADWIIEQTEPVEQQRARGSEGQRIQMVKFQNGQLVK